MSTLIKDSNGDWKQAAGNYSVWSGTRAELEAALAGGTIPNGTVAVVTDDYAMQGVSCVPDWDHAVSVTYAQVSNGYTCPDNGLFVGPIDYGVGQTAILYVNGVMLSYNWLSSGGSTASDGGVQCPVAKGDVVSVSSAVSSRGGKEFNFVPWKK